MHHPVVSRLVNDHRPGRLVDLEILADLKIMDLKFLISNINYLIFYQILGFRHC